MQTFARWVLLGVGMGLITIAVSAATERPNVVMIIADDQTYRDFGFMGNPHVRTPHLDRLAARSARFPNGYVPTSVCSPSLATLLTGLYPHQHGIHSNHPPPGNAGFNRMTSAEEYRRIRGRSFRLIRQAPTWPRVLGSLGYPSLQTGKFWEGHHRNAGFTEGMTTFDAPPSAQTFGGVRTLASGVRVAHGNGDRGLIIGRETMQPISNFLNSHAGRSPFAIWYAPYLPHQPHDSPEQYFKLYAGDPEVADHQRPYYASISQFDDTVGFLVRQIEKRGLAEQTLFVFVVDNGWTPSERRDMRRENFFHHTRESKRSPYDDGLRTPILLRWDGVIVPATHQGLVSSIDIVPTVLSACGIGEQSASLGLPGMDLMPVAIGKGTLDPNRPLFGEIYPGDATALGDPSRDIAYRWLRQGDYKLIVPHRRLEFQGEAWGSYLSDLALFNVVEDPMEQVNLATRPEYRERVETMQQALDAWWLPGR